jgi:hypothetical protein
LTNLCVNVQTMVSTGSKHLSSTAKSKHLPSLGSTARLTRCWPSSVRSSHGVSASVIFSKLTAFLVAKGGGGSGALAKKSAMDVLKGASNLAAKQSSCKGRRRISGVAWLMNQLNLCREYMRKHWPG